MTKERGKGIWHREIEKALKRFDASLEWLMERIVLREEMEKIRHDDEIEEREKNQKLKAMKMRSINELIEDVRVLIDIHYFDEFSRTKSSIFLKKRLTTRV